MSAHLCGLFRAICTNNVDPEKLHRIRLKVPAVFGGEFETNWAWPCVPPGWPDPVKDHTNEGAHAQFSGDGSHSHDHVLVKTVPAVGDPVWVMFENGESDKPVWLGVWVKR